MDLPTRTSDPLLKQKTKTKQNKTPPIMTGQCTRLDHHMVPGQQAKKEKTE
jgi:hypothetical protein